VAEHSPKADDCRRHPDTGFLHHGHGIHHHAVVLAWRRGIDNRALQRRAEIQGGRQGMQVELCRLAGQMTRSAA
jgi:hypothetical protein